ncbi:MAG: N-acetylmuramoyl-L-alanine amidase [Desulfobacterales bacterium]|nr:N-acetylmuramoyl-L-alanine amidase [Desulfobacteraceae bacterium]MBT4364678.1 N-acetylmuramoyl-L-alanine amidase [Desulfobacteraceae bacterium]MBT7084968.1 N-acetylmuramoyl-L-alanine amidase [Desulfobacterales bacterium]MBT7697681.1 N-acetylmuramoyl-L-alanine amidase [Desulfobacterales bacterium]
MSKYIKMHQKKRFMAIIYTIVIILFYQIYMNNELSAEEKTRPLEANRTIVIDPGHGGHDKGVAGADGSYEKQVTLKLARMIKTRLKNKLKVELTRSDDYQIDIPNRTAKANSLKAELFISIHTGGSYLHKTDGINILYYKDISSSLPNNTDNSNKDMPGDIIKTSWNNIQTIHITKSKSLAGKLKSSIFNEINLSEINILEAPLAILSGADMPSLILEIGYLTNPVEEKKLNDQKYLSNIANGIIKGIEKFLAKN